MVLRTESDAAHLVCPKARSRMGGYHCLSDIGGNLLSGPALVSAKVIRNAAASAAEAEAGALRASAQEAVGIRNLLEEMGHPQPPTPIKTDVGLMAALLSPPEALAGTRQADNAVGSQHWV